MLEFDKDKDFILDGVRHGFRITEKTSVYEPVSQQNHYSALKHKTEVENELKSQVIQGNYVIASKQPTVVSALAAIPKDDGKVRIIHDGSRPIGYAMNDYSIPDSTKFQTLRDACKLAKPGYFCAKIDLQAAYRSVPIHPDDYDVTGIQWTFKGDSEPTFLFDARLPFGSNKGPSHFHRLSQAIRRSMIREGCNGIVAYLDDFFIAAPTFDECKYWMLELISLLRTLGFYISYKKVVGPTQNITFLGININTQNSTLTLSEEKIQRLKDQLLCFSKRKRASKQQLQSLAGSLNYACQAIRGGRFFLRRILDTIKSLEQQRHKALLSPSFHKDVQWWLSFLSLFNGTVYFNDSSSEHVHVDACNIASGAFWRGDWHYLLFQCDHPAACDLHINYKEICAVLHAFNRWAHLWAGKNVVIHTDSIVTKCVLNRGWCRNGYVNSLLRKLAFQSARLNISMKAMHVPGSLNVFPDTISRLHERGKIVMLQKLLSNWYHGHVPFSFPCSNMSWCAFSFLLYRCLQFR